MTCLLLWFLMNFQLLQPFVERRRGGGDRRLERLLARPRHTTNETPNDNGAQQKTEPMRGIPGRETKHDESNQRSRHQGSSNSRFSCAHDMSTKQRNARRLQKTRRKQHATQRAHIALVGDVVMCRCRRRERPHRRSPPPLGHALRVPPLRQERGYRRTSHMRTRWTKRDVRRHTRRRVRCTRNTRGIRPNR